MYNALPFSPAAPALTALMQELARGIERNVPYLVGCDAQRAGSTDVALIGSAELRVHAPAYSLPPGVTTAQVAFAGGLSAPGEPAAGRAGAQGAAPLRLGRSGAAAGA